MNHPVGRKRGCRAKSLNCGIRFNHVGLNGFEPTFANLEQFDGEEAWGVLLNVSKETFEELIHAEPSYYLIPVRVEGPDREVVEAQTLTLYDFRKGAQEQIPSARYARLLWKGAVFHELPKDVTDRYYRLFKNGPKMTLYFKPVFALLRPLILWHTRKKVGRFPSLNT